MEKSKIKKAISTMGTPTFPNPMYLSNTMDEPTEDGYVSILKDFSNSTTAHGIPHIITAKNMFMKLCWFIVTSGALTVLLIQEYALLKDYFGHPYTTKIDLITRTNLTFPAVTVCNMNRMRRSTLVGTRFEGLLQVDGGTSESDPDYDWWFESQSAEDSAENQSEGIDVTTEQQTENTFTTSQQSYTLDGNSGVIDETATFVDSDAPTSTDNQEESSVDDTTDESVHERRKRRAKDTIKRRIRDTASSSEDEKYNNFEWLADYDFDEDNFVDDDTYDWSEVTDENDWQGFYEHSKLEDFSDILNVANPTKEELQNYGHQPEDFILQCTFDKKSCNYTDFYMFQNKHYGNCFTFNHGRKNSVIRSTSKSGAQFGLQLTLFVEQPEYIGLFSHMSGVRVSIHDASEAVFPEDQGIVAPTGMATSIGIKQSSIVRLPLPHGNCSKGNDIRFNTHNASYSQQLCIRSCLQEELLSKCGCVTDVGLEEHQLCSYLNSAQKLCGELIYSFYNDDKLHCDCPVACSETDYVTSSSNAVWPSERYEEHLSRRLSTKNKKAERLLNDGVETTRLNLARVEVYYEELNFQSAKQIPTYTVSSILGAFGGLLGLYVGISVITITEVIVLLLQTIVYFIKRAICMNKIYPLNVK